LLPFSIEELEGSDWLADTWETHVLKGLYPRTYDAGLSPVEFFPDYLLTYAERDVRQILNVTDLTQFQRFMRLCAGRVGQMVNISQLGAELGLDQRTVRAWLSVLEASFIVYLLPSFHQNYEKRVVKTPKLYFYDSGLAAWLLGMRTSADFLVHFARGALFENFVLHELRKCYWNRGEKPGFFFWQDSNANEIDLIIENGTRLDALEIKSGKTIQPDFFKNLDRFEKISDGAARRWLVYGGDQTQVRQSGRILNWRNLGELLT
jgi:uncharacterized protein